MEPFMINAIRWLSRKSHLNDVKVGSYDQHMFTTRVGHATKHLKPGNLSDHHIYIANAHVEMTPAEREAVMDYVNDGGGLMIGGQAWSWNGGYKDRSSHFVKDYPGNK